MNDKQVARELVKLAREMAALDIDNEKRVKAIATALKDGVKKAGMKVNRMDIMRAARQFVKDYGWQSEL